MLKLKLKYSGKFLLAGSISVACLSACAQQDFAGSSGAQKLTSDNKTQTDETTNDNNNNGTDTSGGLSTDDGGSIQGSCAKGQAIEDPNQTMMWVSKLRAGDDIKGFVNSFNRYTFVNVGALYFDAPTAKFVCNLNGFLDQIGYTEGSFHSPGDNNIYRWDPNQKKLIESNANSSGNHTIKSYTCKGKLKDPCKNDVGWIFQPLP